MSSTFIPRMFIEHHLRYRRYMMVPKDDNRTISELNSSQNLDENDENDVDGHDYTSMNLSKKKRCNPFNREKYSGALLFNFITFILPALYSTLSKLWVADIDSSLVVLTDANTYMGVVVEVINEGLPRAAWVIIGDKTARSIKSRIGLSYTLITFQSILGLILSLIFLTCAEKFAKNFVPIEVRNVSISYVRITSFNSFASCLETSISYCTRALDKPDVPLIISSIKFFINIVLDFLIISKFHVGNHNPNVNDQAKIQLSVNIISSFTGLLYFMLLSKKFLKHSKSNEGSDRSERLRRLGRSEFIENIQTDVESNAETFSTNLLTVKALSILLRPGILTFIESAIRNALYLWLITTIVDMGSDYATAWGIFITIRWGLIMVPIQALEQTSLTFIGHEWGKWRNLIGINERKPKINIKSLKCIIRPAIISCAIALSVEIPICILLSTIGAKAYARWLSNSDKVADITAHMWKTIDCTQLATILLATRPKWYLYQSLGSNILYVLPWAIACQIKTLNPNNAWTYHSLVFGGSLVFSFVDIIIVVSIWSWTLLTGKVTLEKWIDNVTS